VQFFYNQNVPQLQASAQAITKWCFGDKSVPRGGTQFQKRSENMQQIGPIDLSIRHLSQ
jgi:hypothetical protein